MRDGLDAPTLQLAADSVAEIRAFLDGQLPIELAVWVRHEQHGPDGRSYDHHLMLGVADRAWEAGDMRALEEGMELPALAAREPTWIDLYPVSEVGALRAFGTVLWEQASPGDDPLDYRFTYEPFAADPPARDRFVAVLERQPAIRSVGATVQKLWKAEELVRETAQLTVEASPTANVLLVAAEAARETVLAGWPFSSCTIGRPSRDASSLLYEARA